MSGLCSKYCELLEKQGMVSPSCRSCILKARLVALFGESISFHRPARKDMSVFMFNSDAHRGALIERCAKAEAEDEGLTVMDVIDPQCHGEQGFPSRNLPVTEVFQAAAFLRSEVYSLRKQPLNSI